MDESLMDMDAAVFKHCTGSHNEYIRTAFEFLIEAYQELIKNRYNAYNNSENTIRDDLVKIAKLKKNRLLPFLWITEFTDIENHNRIDINLATPQSLFDESDAIKIECKIVGEDKYIDTRSSFGKEKSPTNGIMSFITGKYSPQMPLAGMIGFIKDGDINLKIDRIINRLQKHNDIKTLKNLTKTPIKDDFEYSYDSRHKRINDLNDISIYHLFFDFT